MGFYLRSIRRTLWLAEEPWLIPNDYPSDIYRDILTDNNRLSFWFIEDYDTDIQNVLIAILSNRDRLCTIDYVVVKEEIFKDLNIKFKDTPGETPIRSFQSLHRDAIELSANMLSDFLTAIKRKEGVASFFHRRTRSQVKSIVKEFIRGHADPDEIPNHFKVA